MNFTDQFALNIKGDSWGLEALVALFSGVTTYQNQEKVTEDTWASDVSFYPLSSWTGYTREGKSVSFLYWNSSVKNGLQKSIFYKMFVYKIESMWKRWRVTKRVQYLGLWVHSLHTCAWMQYSWKDETDCFYCYQLLWFNGFGSDLYWLLRWLCKQNRLNFSDILVYIHKSIYLFLFSWYFIRGKYMFILWSSLTPSQVILK